MTVSTIHILDDDAPFRESLAFALSANGFEVSIHADPEAFLRESADAGPACVICDIRMPGLSGIEVTQALRARAAATHVILVTGHADASLVRRAMDAGADRVLEKPFPTQRLVAILRDLFQQNAPDKRGG